MDVIQVKSKTGLELHLGRDKDAKSRKVLINLNTVQTGPIHMIIELDVYNPYQKKVHETLYSVQNWMCGNYKVLSIIQNYKV